MRLDESWRLLITIFFRSICYSSRVSGKLTPRARKFIAAAALLLLGLIAFIIGLAVGLTDNRTSLTGDQQSQDATKSKKSLEDTSTTQADKGSDFTTKRGIRRESQRDYYQSAAVTTDTNICSQYGA